MQVNNKHKMNMYIACGLQQLDIIRLNNFNDLTTVITKMTHHWAFKWQ